MVCHLFTEYTTVEVQVITIVGFLEWKSQFIIIINRHGSNEISSQNPPHPEKKRKEKRETNGRGERIDIMKEIRSTYMAQKT